VEGFKALARPGERRRNLPGMHGSQVVSIGSIIKI
jgi:hypothetical protein